MRRLALERHAGDVLVGVGLQQQMQATGAEFYNEQVLGRGFMPYLIFSQPSQALPAERPVQFGSNTLALAGVLIGFILALFFVAADLPLTLAKRMRHAAASAEPLP